MSRNLADATSSIELATTADPVCWRRALKTFLDTLGSPRTVRAHERAVTEAMEAIGADLVADLTPPMLAEYRAGLVARLDADREDWLSPSTVSLKLSALRSFLHFCRIARVTALSKDVIAFVLKSPRAEVCRPYEVLSETERRRFLDAASEQGLRDHTLVSLALGAGMRVSELVNPASRISPRTKRVGGGCGCGWVRVQKIDLCRCILP